MGFLVKNEFQSKSENRKTQQGQKPKQPCLNENRRNNKKDSDHYKYDEIMVRRNRNGETGVDKRDRYQFQHRGKGRKYRKVNG